MADQAKNILIGLFVIAASMIVVFILFFLHPKVGDEGKTLRVRFSDIDKVTVGTRVTYGGKPVGEVVNIIEIVDEENARVPLFGKIYLYELLLKVDSSVNVFNSDEIALRTSGLLGEKSVAITPLPPKEGVPLQRITNEVLFANESGSVEETLKEVRDIGDKVETALETFIHHMNEIEGQKLWQHFGKTFANLEDITNAVNRPAQWSQLLTNLTQFSNRVNTSWQDTVEPTVRNLDALVNDVRSGRGSLGRLVAQDDFYLRLTSVMAKAETLMDDVNHYGVLFHLDKGWQRTRARRANLLNRLASPQEFRNYFQDELNQVTTSLARVSDIMQEAQCSPCGEEPLVYNEEFRKVFAELLRRIDAIELSIKLYNTQLNAPCVMETEFCP